MKIRPARMQEVPLLNALIERSATVLSAGFYTDAQTRAVNREVFGVDTQLVADGTYYVVEEDGAMVACGGWSKRSTPYGADHAKTEPDALLDPAVDAARIRAFFVDPAHARKGIGRALLRHCAAAAADAGFTRLELTATLPGVPLYAAEGFTPVHEIAHRMSDGTIVPFLKMERACRV